MQRILRVATLLFLPLLTFVLGWQASLRFEGVSIERQRQQLEELYGGNSGSGQLVTDPEKEVDLSLLWSVWRLLAKHYIHPENLETQSMIFGAVTGLVNALKDPYTTFMTPQENTQFRQALGGLLEGIGAELTVKDDRIVVVSPLKKSPAANAGLLPKDVIVTVDGENIEGASLAEVVQRIRGPKGTQVTLGIEREGREDLLEFSIVREELRVPSVEGEFRGEDGIGIITINQFGEETIAEAKKALDALPKDRLKGLVLDLRYNGGGFLEGAVDLTSFFVPEGEVVSVLRREGAPEVLSVRGNPLFPSTPLVVLINEGSASASEIVAGALQDSKRATLVGTESFGKGTVQEVFDLPGGGSLRVTVARWMTPAGRDLSAKGILPDIEVDRTPEDIEAERDPQMEKAVEVLEGKKQ